MDSLKTYSISADDSIMAGFDEHLIIVDHTLLALLARLILVNRIA